MTLLVTDGKIFLADKRGTEVRDPGDMRCPQCNSKQRRINDTTEKIMIPAKNLSKPITVYFKKRPILAYAVAGSGVTRFEIQVATLHVDLYDLLNYFNSVKRTGSLPKEHKGYFPFKDNTILLLVRDGDRTKTVKITIDDTAKIEEFDTGAVVSTGSGATRFRTHHYAGGLNMLDAFQLAAYQERTCNFGCFDAAVIDSNFDVTVHKGVRYKRSIEELLEVYKSSLDEVVKKGKR